MRMDLGEGRKAPFDHLLGTGERDPEIAGKFTRRTSYDKDIVISERVRERRISAVGAQGSKQMSLRACEPRSRCPGELRLSDPACAAIGALDREHLEFLDLCGFVDNTPRSRTQGAIGALIFDLNVKLL
jgi:hypothetical protein